jgi:DNA repair exonuclease SbcCD nuclease subunit
VERGYDYWALGHVHQREIVCEDPWVVFPGNLQGRHARETGPKGATLVTVEDGSVVSLEACDLDVVRWSDCSVDVSEAASAHDVVDRVREVLEVEAERVGDRLLAARVQLRGRTPADSELRCDLARWRGEIRASAMDIGTSIWVEKIVFDTQPDIDVDALMARDDPVANLVRAVRGVADDEGALSEIIESLESLTSKLPAEYRRLPGAIDFGSRDGVTALLQGVEKNLLPRLLGIRGQQ